MGNKVSAECGLRRFEFKRRKLRKQLNVKILDNNEKREEKRYKKKDTYYENNLEIIVKILESNSSFSVSSIHTYFIHLYNT